MPASRRKAKKSAKKKAPAKKKSAKKVVKRSAKKAPKKSAKKVGRARKAAKPKKAAKKAPARKATKTKKAAKSRPATKPTKAAKPSRSKRVAFSPTSKPVTFVLDAPSGWDVCIAGTFNNWEPKAMFKDTDGMWRITLRLEPGNYQYKYLIDTEWREDPNNPEKKINELGGYNSILNVSK